MCMIDGGERYDVLSQERRRARKAHRCGECFRDIAPGETYEYATGLIDGTWNTHRTCLHCVAARAWLAKVCGGWMYEGVAEDLQEHIDHGYNPRWLNLAVSGIRKKWRAPDGSMRRPMSLPKNLPVPA